MFCDNINLKGYLVYSRVYHDNIVKYIYLENNHFKEELLITYDNLEDRGSVSQRRL